MVDLSVTWLGLPLKSPLVVGAGPLSDDDDGLRAAVVLRSLFEEQLRQEQMAAFRFLDRATDTDAEAGSFLPDVDVFASGAEPYLRRLRQVRALVDVPVIASLNGTTPGGWTEYARVLAGTGASAIELNLYDVAVDPAETSAHIEDRQIAVVEEVVRVVSIPVTVKLGPHYASVPAFVKRLEEAGARGVAVFNRFYQPDVDLDALDVDRAVVLSTPHELPERLHALARLAPWSSLDLACTGGVHSGRDVAKAIVCGAHVVQLTSTLLLRGPAHVGDLRRDLAAWLEEKEYAAVGEARGVLARHRAPDPRAWERFNYIRVLDGWRRV